MTYRLHYQRPAFKRPTRAACGCAGCKRRAVAQFYICALGGHVAVCREHDYELNYIAMALATGYNRKEVEKWMTPYRARMFADLVLGREAISTPDPTDSPRPKRKGRAGSSKRKLKSAAKFLLSKRPSA